MDIYQINSVMHGDCVALMRRMESESIDFILTDPPYITHYRSRERVVESDGASPRPSRRWRRRRDPGRVLPAGFSCVMVRGFT